MLCGSKLNNETNTFREMLNQLDASNFESAIDKDTSACEFHE